MARSNQQTGNHAEQRASEYLCRHGLTPITRNYRCRGGEIDLVMRDKQATVFVEVRYRRSDCFGSALESVDARKQRRLITAAQHFLLTHKSNACCRFDVVGIGGDGEINWIRNAFTQ